MAVKHDVDIPDDEKLIMSESQLDLTQAGAEEKLSLRQIIKRSGKLFAVKPVMVLYLLSYAVTAPVTSQLWIDRVCSVNLGYNATICEHLTDDKNVDYENKVQEAVATYNIAGSYIENIPNIIMALYLGPWSDQGRKNMMFLPFVGHLLSGTFYFVFVYFKTWPAQLLWVTNIYVLFGGYTLLQIAMYGYIGDVTNAKERTTIMSILGGLGFIMFPLAEFASGQIYKVGGYYAVYGTSLGGFIIGILYIFFIPESVTARPARIDNTLSEHNGGSLQKIWHFIKVGNITIVNAFKVFLKKRDNNVHKFVYALVGITLLSGLSRPFNSILLFVEKMFGWTVVDYTNYTSFSIGIFVVRMFITTPILCYWLGIHDCMLAITGGIAAIGMDVTFGLATKGWMMYYGAAITIFAGIQQTPITSLLSKCVDSSELGQILTMQMLLAGVANLITSSLMQLLYAATVSYAPGAVFFIAAGFEVLAIIAMIILYIFIHKHETIFGDLGKLQDKH